MTELVRSYTHDAGVRNLERELANVMRKVARQGRRGSQAQDRHRRQEAGRAARPQRFEYGELEAEDQTGAATGLDVTEVGATWCAIEVTRMEGQGRLHPDRPAGRGHARVGASRLSWTRAHAHELGIPREVFEEDTLHIHVPAGAIPEGRPSAGITMATPSSAP